MKHVLKENLDYQFKQSISVYRTTHLSAHLRSGKILMAIKNPRPNTVVMLRKFNKLIPILIIDGEFEVNGQITNEWKWQRILENRMLDDIEVGIGDFYETHKEYSILFKQYALAYN